MSRSVKSLKVRLIYTSGGHWIDAEVSIHPQCRLYGSKSHNTTNSTPQILPNSPTQSPYPIPPLNPPIHFLYPIPLPDSPTRFPDLFVDFCFSDSRIFIDFPDSHVSQLIFLIFLF